MKRIISAALTALLLGSTNVYAEEALPEIYIENVYAEENGEAEVLLNIRNNTGIAAYSIEVSYDPEVLAFTEGTVGEDLRHGTFYCNGEYMQESVRAVWSASQNDETNGSLAVLKFRTLPGTADTVSRLDIGYSVLGNKELSEVPFEAFGGEIKITREILKGDVDENEVTNVNDVVSLNMYLLDKDASPLSSVTAEANSDVDEDGNVTLTDSAALINFVCESGVDRL